MLETRHQNALIIGAAVLILVLFSYFMFRKPSQQEVQTTNERDVLSALERVGGDASKLDPATKKKLDETLAKNPLSSAGRYRPGANPGAPKGYPTR